MRVRPEHWELLLNYCETNPELITNHFNGSEGRAKGNALWQTVTTKLNSLGYGEKTVDGWRKTLTDWKSKTKSKAAALKREQQQTGGGPPQAPPLSSLEEKLLEIMGNKAVYGDELVPEIGFGKVEVPKHIKVSKENIPQINETNTTPSVSEHDYCEEVIAGTSGSINKNLKRKLDNQRKPAKKILKSRLLQSNGLVQLSSETVLTLKEIRDNTYNMSQSLEKLSESTTSIAESLSILADIAKPYQKIC